MTLALPAILALLTGVAGWFYLFYSRAAHGLAALEDQRLNRKRVRLRRAGGAAMLLLAVGFYVGFYAADPGVHPKLFVAAWIAVLVLLAAIVVLALIDVRLTFRLRRRRHPPDSNHPHAKGNDLDRLPPP